MYGVVPAAAVTAYAKPHAQQEIARDLEVNYRRPPDKYGRLTLGRPCVRCYSTLRAWSPVCSSTLRFSLDSMTTKGNIYVPGTYRKYSFFIFRLMRYTDVCFFSLPGVLFPRE